MIRYEKGRKTTFSFFFFGNDKEGASIYGGGREKRWVKKKAKPKAMGTPKLKGQYQW